MDALRKRQDRIKFILVRHEEMSAFMACAYAKYTGKLGACVATSGPGAIHLLNPETTTNDYLRLNLKNIKQTSFLKEISCIKRFVTCN